MYISPSLTKDPIAPLDDLLDTIHSSFSGQTCLVTGDFNFPELDWNCLSVRTCSRQKALHKSFLNCVFSHCLEQLVDGPTHILGNTLDLIFTNETSFITNFNILKPSLSDYFMIEMSLDVSFEKACRHDNKKCFVE